MSIKRPLVDDENMGLGLYTNQVLMGNKNVKIKATKWLSKNKILPASTQAELLPGEERKRQVDPENFVYINLRKRSYTSQ